MGGKLYDLFVEYREGDINLILFMDSILISFVFTTYLYAYIMYFRYKILFIMRFSTFI